MGVQRSTTEYETESVVGRREPRKLEWEYNGVQQSTRLSQLWAGESHGKLEWEYNGVQQSTRLSQLWAGDSHGKFVVGEELEVGL
jgi:hypothetical protein